MSEINQSSQQKQVYNTPYISESALQIRLGTEEILTKIELFLRGKQQILEAGEDGKPELKIIECGEPKANSLGVQSLLNRITAIFNPATVQGNYSKEMYFSHVGMLRESLADSIVSNREKWEIEIHNCGDIVDMIMDSIKPFLSRVIENKERESYANTMNISENNNTQDSNRPRLFG